MFFIICICRWVVDQSKHDQELLFFESTTDENNNRMFKKLKFADEKDYFSAGDQYMFPSSERSNNKKTTAIELVGFIPDHSLHNHSVSFCDDSIHSRLICCILGI